MAIKNRMRSSRNRIPSDKNTAHYQQVQQAAAELDKAIQAMNPSAGEAALELLFRIVFIALLIGLLIAMMGLLIFVFVHPIWVLWGGWGLVVISQVVTPSASLTERVGGLLNGCVFCIFYATMTPPLIPLTMVIRVLGILTVIVIAYALCKAFQN